MIATADAKCVHGLRGADGLGVQVSVREARVVYDECLVHLAKLPLESLQLGEGFESAACIPLIKSIATLRRLTLTNATKVTDAELKTVAALTQLEHIELSKVPLPDERLPMLKDFAFLKSMRLVPVKEPFSDETQAKIKALLPRTEIQFK